MKKYLDQIDYESFRRDGPLHRDAFFKSHFKSDFPVSQSIIARHALKAARDNQSGQQAGRAVMPSFRSVESWSAGSQGNLMRVLKHQPSLRFRLVLRAARQVNSRRVSRG